MILPALALLCLTTAAETPPERAVAEHAARAQHRAFVEFAARLKLSAQDKDGKLALCDAGSASVAAAKGVPSPGAQAQLAMSAQGDISSAVYECSRKLRLTGRTARDFSRAYLHYAAAVAGAAYCREDADCMALEVDAEPCEDGPTLTAAASKRGSPTFEIMSRYAPNLLQVMGGAIVEGLPKAAAEKLARDWRCAGFAQTPRKAVCAENTCRPAP